jgi:hypothetical protein
MIPEAVWNMFSWLVRLDARPAILAGGSAL